MTLGHRAAFGAGAKSGMLPAMRGTTIWLKALVFLLLSSCGGSKPPPEGPTIASAPPGESVKVIPLRAGESEPG